WSNLFVMALAMNISVERWTEPACNIQCTPRANSSWMGLRIHAAASPLRLPGGITSIADGVTPAFEPFHRSHPEAAAPASGPRAE
ncbi:MAG TPA: hypothetical protein VH681_00545, partial [Nitrospiraceae bacterium]